MDEPRGQRVYVAGMWRRLLAAALDAVVLSPVFLFVGWLTSSITGLELPRGGRFLPENLVEYFLEGGVVLYGTLGLGLLLIVLYGAIFTLTTGATPGLRLLRMKVINVYGSAPEWWRMVLRSCGFLVSCALLGLGFLWIGFDREKRGLPDWLAGTYVIDSRAAGTE